MELYVDEAQMWKCSKHPSRRRKTGICPKCLRDRLVTLCPNCATALPCACCPASADVLSSSSSSSSSFSLFSFSRGGSRRDFATSATSNVETDPALRRSRSSAIPFLRSRSKYVGNKIGGCEVVENNKPDVVKVSRSKINFWSVFTVNKSKKCDEHGCRIDNGLKKSHDLNKVNDNSMMMRSRSVAVGGGNGFSQVKSKQKGWYFPSPINTFRHSKPPRSVAVA